MLGDPGGPSGFTGKTDVSRCVNAPSTFDVCLVPVVGPWPSWWSCAALEQDFPKSFRKLQADRRADTDRDIDTEAQRHTETHTITHTHIHTHTHIGARSLRLEASDEGRVRCRLGQGSRHGEGKACLAGASLVMDT